MNQLEFIQSLQNQLFFTTEANVFVILDGASVPLLLNQLERHQPEYYCLYRGQLTRDLAEVVPYLVRLEKDSEFLNWILEQGYGQHWGIFAVAPANLRILRQHFRNLLTIQAPDGNSFYFRFYDPRVFRVYLPTCHAHDKIQLFGPVIRYLVEDEDQDQVFLHFSP
jgi:hypothetical protein